MDVSHCAVVVLTTALPGPVLGGKALLLLGGMGGWQSTGRAAWERRKARTGSWRGTKGEISCGEIQWGETKEYTCLGTGHTVTLLGLGIGLDTPNL